MTIMDEDSFTLRGYNDSPEPCLENGCEGLVELTHNANVGRCSSCGIRYDWADYHRQRDAYETQSMH